MKIKGFIEVTLLSNKKNTLLNVSHITQVSWGEQCGKVYLDDALACNLDYDVVICVEGYEEIKNLIQEAME